MAIEARTYSVPSYVWDESLPKIEEGGTIESKIFLNHLERFAFLDKKRVK